MNINKYQIEDQPVDALYRVMQIRHKVQAKKPEHEWLEWLDLIENTLRRQREQMQKMSSSVKSYQQKIERLQNFTSKGVTEIAEQTE